MNPTLGILGGGQLAKMLASAAANLGVRTRIWDPSPKPPAAIIAEHLRAPFDDPAAANAFTNNLTAATYEFENIPEPTAAAVARAVPLFPNPKALQISADRLTEKRHLQSLDIPVPTFHPISTPQDIAQAQASFPFPAILKARRLGYDGKGQAQARTPADLQSAWQSLNQTDCILEHKVPFQRELSVIVARDRHANTRVYPLCQNHHEQGILRTTIAPADAPDDLIHNAAQHATNLAHSLGYVGVLTLELFQHNNQLLANEFAPRVHNSGHWTIEAAAISQFENHIRAVLDLPLGPTQHIAHAHMINFISAIPPIQELAAIPNLAIHHYTKQPRPNRKLGHATITAHSPQQAATIAEQVQQLIADHQTQPTRQPH